MLFAVEDGTFGRGKNMNMQICYLDISASYSHSSLALPMLHQACEGLVEADWSVVRGTIKEDVHAIAARVADLKPVAKSPCGARRKAPRGVADQRNRLGRIATGGDQCGGERADAARGHVEHERRRGVRQGRPVDAVRLA